MFVEPSKVVTFFDAVPHADGAFSVAWLDGHVKREAKVPALAVKYVIKKAITPPKKAHEKR